MARVVMALVALMVGAGCHSHAARQDAAVGDDVTAADALRLCMSLCAKQNGCLPAGAIENDCAAECESTATPAYSSEACSNAGAIYSCVSAALNATCATLSASLTACPVCDVPDGGDDAGDGGASLPD